LVADGINLYNGNLDLTFGLLNYNSLFSGTSWVGDKWALDLGYIIKEENNYFLVSASKASKLVSVGGNEFKAEKYVPLKIYIEDGKFIVVSSDGAKSIYGNINKKNNQAYKWDLTETTDTNGNKIQYTYTKESYVFDESLEISYLSEITDMYGGKTQFVISDRTDLADNNGKKLKKLDRIASINPDLKISQEIRPF